VVQVLLLGVLVTVYPVSCSSVVHGAVQLTTALRPSRRDYGSGCAGTVSASATIPEDAAEAALGPFAFVATTRKV